MAAPDNPPARPARSPSSPGVPPTDPTPLSALTAPSHAATTLPPSSLSPSPSSSTSSPPSPPAASRSRYNTDKLVGRVGADVGAALGAGALVAPVITIIDRAIIENSAGRNPLVRSVGQSFRELVTRPHRFVAARPFRLILALYAGTYTTANTIDTLSSTLRNRPAGTVTHGPAKFGATTAANISLCLYKDSQFARMFGGSVSAAASSSSVTTPGALSTAAASAASSTAALATRAVPVPSLLLFGLRDCLTVFASFNLPPVIAPHLPAHVLGFDLAAGPAGSVVTRANVAQFVAPVAIQLLSTPIHLLGLDLYNRPSAGQAGPPFRDRVRKVAREWGISCLARMGRILPAFGVGGVVNASVRRRLMDRLETDPV